MIFVPLCSCRPDSRTQLTNASQRMKATGTRPRRRQISEAKHRDRHDDPGEGAHPEHPPDRERDEQHDQRPGDRQARAAARRRQPGVGAAPAGRGRGHEGACAHDGFTEPPAVLDAASSGTAGTGVAAGSGCRWGRRRGHRWIAAPGWPADWLTAGSSVASRCR